MGSEVTRPGSNPDSSLCSWVTSGQVLTFLSLGFLLCSNDTKLFGLRRRLKRDSSWQVHPTQREASFVVGLFHSY